MGLLNTLSFLLNHPLSQGRKLATLRRFVAWQIGARLVPGPVVCPFANGSWLLAQPGLTGATGNVYVGLHEFADMAFVLHVLGGEDLFVDVGANIGSYTVLAAAGTGAACLAFEPGSAAFIWLERNVRLNGITDRTELHRQAVGARSGPMALTADGDTVNHIVTDPTADSRTETVAMTTLDEALAGRTPLMLKIDVEGFETEVLNGAIQTLNAPTLRAAGTQRQRPALRLRRRRHSPPIARQRLRGMRLQPLRAQAARPACGRWRFGQCSVHPRPGLRGGSPPRRPPN